MAFGIDQLTDDQLLELLQEACAELGARDPIVRNLAQNTIITQADQLAAKKSVAKEALEEALSEYRESIKRDAIAELRTAVNTGEVRLLTPEQEAHASVEAGLTARQKLIEEALNGLMGGGTTDPNRVDDFALRVREGSVSLLWGNQRSHWKATPGSSQLHELARLIQRAFGATGPAFGSGGRW